MSQFSIDIWQWYALIVENFTMRSTVDYFKGFLVPQTFFFPRKIDFVPARLQGPVRRGNIMISYDITKKKKTPCSFH